MIGITGASGVLGNIICNKLQSLGMEYSCFSGDVCSIVDVNYWLNNTDIDSIIHLAAIVPTKVVSEDPLHAFEVNVSGTINLLSAFAKKATNRSKWFFYASTSHVYKSSNLPITEENIIEPITLYGKTKLCAENIVSAIENADVNINTCIGRIFSFYHETQKTPFLYPTIIKRLKEEDLTKEFFLYGADSIRDFLNAEEVIDIIIKLFNNRSTGIYNIASGKPTKIRDFVQNLTDKKLNIVTAGQMDYLVADITKLKNEIGEIYDK